MKEKTHHSYNLNFLLSFLFEVKRIFLMYQNSILIFFREERRWMERQNQTKRQGKEKAERQRINNLVDMAYKLDPRVKKQLEAEKKEKEEKRLARIEAKNRDKNEKVHFCDFISKYS